MPIYDQAYKPWEGTLIEKPKTWWVIARTGIRVLWQKWLVVLLVASSFPFAVRAVQIYLNSRVGSDDKFKEFSKYIEVNPGFFEGFLKGQSFLLALLLVIVGAGLIAQDRRFRALQIYFSKPINFWDYVGGKFLILVAYAGLITIVPALLLFVIQLMLTPDTTFLSQYYWIPFSVLGAFIVSVTVLGSMMLALSSVVSARPAAVLFFALIWFPEIMRNILSRIPEAGFFSVSASLRQILSLFLGTERPYDFSTYGAAVGLVLTTAICLGVLAARIRPTEVVS